MRAWHRSWSEAWITQPVTAPAARHPGKTISGSRQTRSRGGGARHSPTSDLDFNVDA
jgi:hypothetical protein